MPINIDDMFRYQDGSYGYGYADDDGLMILQENGNWYWYIVDEYGYVEDEMPISNICSTPQEALDDFNMRSGSRRKAASGWERLTDKYVREYDGEWVGWVFDDGSWEVFSNLGTPGDEGKVSDIYDAMHECDMAALDLGTEVNGVFVVIGNRRCSSVDYSVVKDIDPSWSDYDKTVAKGQLATYGEIYVDSYGQPIDDEYVLMDIEDERGIFAKKGNRMNKQERKAFNAGFKSAMRKQSKAVEVEGIEEGFVLSDYAAPGYDGYSLRPVVDVWLNEDEGMFICDVEWRSMEYYGIYGGGYGEGSTLDEAIDNAMRDADFVDYDLSFLEREFRTARRKRSSMKKRAESGDMQFIVCLCDSSDNVLCELERSGDGFYMIPKDAVDDIYLVNGETLKVKDIIR